MPATTANGHQTSTTSYADRLRPTSKEQAVRDRFVVWLRSLDPVTELAPFVARWLFAGLEHQLDPSENWDDFTTRKPKAPLAGSYWVQLMTGDKQVDAELLAQFEDDFAEEATDYAVLVSVHEFPDEAHQQYDNDSRVLLYNVEYFLRKFAGLLYHPDSWRLMLAKAMAEMAHPDQFINPAEAQPVLAGGAQPRHPGGRGRPPQQQQRRRFGGSGGGGGGGGGGGKRSR